MNSKIGHTFVPPRHRLWWNYIEQKSFDLLVAILRESRKRENYIQEKMETAKGISKYIRQPSRNRGPDWRSLSHRRKV